MSRPEAPMQRRKCEVSGTDESGDVRSFATDDRERAEGVMEIMREDLADVRLVEVATTHVESRESSLSYQFCR